MQRSKLIRLLKKIDAQTLNKFEYQLSLLSTEKGKQSMELFLYVYSFSPSYSSMELNRKMAFEKIHPEDEYKDGTIRREISELLELLENFLVCQDVKNKKNGNVRGFLIVMLYECMNLYDYFKQNIRKIMKEINKNEHKNKTDYLELHQLNERMYFHPDTQKYGRTGRTVEHIEAAMNNLDKYYVLSKLQYACEVLSRQNILSTEHKIEFLEESLQFVEQHCLEDGLLFILYRNLVLLHQKGWSKELYDASKRKFVDYINENGDKQDIRRIWQNLLNILMRAQNTDGNIKLVHKIAELYRIGEKNNVLMLYDRITDGTYLNAISVNAKCKHFDWVDDFLAKYEPAIEIDLREDTKNLALAYHYFHQKKFDDAYKALGVIEKFHKSHTIRIKELTVRTLYELDCQANGWEILLHTYLERFDDFLRKNKALSTSRRTTLLNFKKEVYKLYMIRSRGKLIKKSKKEVWKTALMKRKDVALKEWLLEKIDELKEKK